MSFAWPIALSGLALVALALIAYLVAQRRRRRYVVRFTNLDLLENVVADSPRWRRHIPAVLTLLALSALVVGMARPQVAVAVPREEATVILAMDSSGSMTATDVEPDRMTAAREAASSFVDGLPDGFRVGVVSFSNEADVVVPPTADHDEALRGLSALRADNGTALGDAIARSVDLGVTNLDEQLAANSSETPVVVLLLSDGANTTGDYEPLEAAEKAKDAKRPGLHRRSRHRRGHGPGPRRLRRHADDPRPTGPGDPLPGGRADRRQVLRSRRPGRPRERVRRDRLAGRRRARAA